MEATAPAGKSYFYDGVDVAALYEKYKMTGTLKTGKSSKSNKELVDFDNGADYGIDIYTGKSANGMTIHYSKTGVHLVPTYHPVKR